MEHKFRYYECIRTEFIEEFGGFLTCMLNSEVPRDILLNMNEKRTFDKEAFFRSMF